MLQLNKISNYKLAKKYSEDGFSKTSISKILKIDRRTVRKYLQFSDNDFFYRLKQSESRKKKLDEYRTEIVNKINSEPELSACSIFKWLTFKYSAKLVISEKSVFNYIKSIRDEFKIYKKAKEQTLINKIISGILNKTELYEILKESINIDDIDVIYENLTRKTIAYKKRAIIIILFLIGKKSRAIANYINIEKKTADNYIEKYNQIGLTELFDLSTSIIKKTDNSMYKEEFFKILHSPPSHFGLNRTSWKLDDLKKTMKDKGFSISIPLIRKILKNDGYSMKKARKVLTSTDPDYQEKLKKITKILSNLQSNEKFFSIDEYGPFSIRIQGGLSYTKKDEIKSYPQFQKSKGSLIITAALELSTNQLIHFYSTKKNTNEMLKLLNIIIEKYQSENSIYLSWDAASWHISKKLNEKVEEINKNVEQNIIKSPKVFLCPLPACAQFLNVIESVFSGMAKAIIHNSDYQSKEECQVAIDRYFLERNNNFIQK